MYGRLNTLQWLCFALHPPRGENKNKCLFPVRTVRQSPTFIDKKKMIRKPPPPLIKTLYSMYTYKAEKRRRKKTPTPSLSFTSKIYPSANSLPIIKRPCPGTHPTAATNINPRPRSSCRSRHPSSTMPINLPNRRIPDDAEHKDM